MSDCKGVVSLKVVVGGLIDRVAKLESLANTTEVNIGKDIKDCGGFMPLDDCGTMIDSMRKEIIALKTENEQLKSLIHDPELFNYFDEIKSNNESLKKKNEQLKEEMSLIENELNQLKDRFGMRWQKAI